MFIKRWKMTVLFTFLFLFLTACGGTETVTEEVTRVVTETVTETVVEEGKTVSVEIEVTRVVVEEVMAEGGEAIVVSEVEAAIMETSPNAQMPADMFFEEYGVNPFIDVEDDNLSTFAMDVDTGSYTLMRNYLNDGHLPPSESVRVEEYVNYFDQKYPSPEHDAFAIHLEGSPAPYGENERYSLMRVGIQGYEANPLARPDATLIFVIDVSGSMEQDNRLGLVKESLRMLLDNLRPTDRVGLVVYGSRGRVVLEPTAVESRRAIMSAIEELQPEGSTNVEEGLLLAYDLAARYARPGQINRLIVASDGVGNVGNTTAEAILQHAEEGIQLSTFGFGMGNYNDVMMEQLADQGDGSYAYIDSIQEAERVFETQLMGTLFTIAKDAKIQVEFNSEVVERYRLLGYENRDVADEDFRNDEVDAGEVGAGHSVTALYEVKFAEDADPNAVAMTVHVRYIQPNTDAATELEQTITQAEFAPSFVETSPRFQLTAVVAEYAEILRDSYWAQENTMASIAADARRIAEYMPADADVQEFATLVTRAGEMGR